MSGESRRVIAFVAVSGVAAACNFFSRMIFENVAPYGAAVVGAYFVGLSTAFTLNRKFVFEPHHGMVKAQFLRFFLVNLVGLAQTLGASLLLAEWLLPAIGWVLYPHEIAHAVGIALPVVTSYFGHKHFTFRDTASGAGEDPEELAALD